MKEAGLEVMAAATDFDPSDTVAAVKGFIVGLTHLIATNEPLNRAGFIAREWTNYFEHRGTTGIVAQVHNQTLLIRQSAVAQSKLEGRIDEEQIATRLFSSQRLAHLHWMHGYIDPEAYRIQVLIGMLIT